MQMFIPHHSQVACFFACSMVSFVLRGFPKSVQTDQEYEAYMPQINDIGIDLGSSQVVIFMKGRGIIFREPSIIALDRDTRQTLAIGTEAQRMIGRTPANIQVIRPLAQGDLIDFELTSFILQDFLSRAIGRHLFARPRAVMAVPTGVKDMEKKALISSMFDAGVRRTQILDKNIAAALGAQANFQGNYGCLIVDISAGCTDIAVLYNGSVTVLNTLHTGGDQMDDTVIRYLRKKYNLLVGERTAEQIKITLGGAARRHPRVMMEVTGRNLISGLPKNLNIESDEIYESLIDCISALIEGIQAVIERTPPQLASDIFESGVILTGGGANLYGLAEAIQEALNIPCRVAPDARDCVALGCGRMLTEAASLRYLFKQ